LIGKEGFDKKLPNPFISENNHGIDEKLIDAIKKAKSEHLALQESLANEKLANQNEPMGSENSTFEGSILQSCADSEKSTSAYKFRRVSHDIIKEIKNLSTNKTSKRVSPYKDELDIEMTSNLSKRKSADASEKIFYNKLTNVDA
jgi:hypothetical protein